MNEKYNLLKERLNLAVENESKLKIVSIKGNYNCILLEKILDAPDGKILKIKVRSIASQNKDFEENRIFEIDLFDGGLSEIQLIE